MLNLTVYIPLNCDGLKTRVAPLRTLALAAALVLVAPYFSAAQFAPPAYTNVRDASPLKPPPGVRIAILEFADLECPACAAANPVVKNAVAQYKIPWIRHDFLIPGHVWSPQAAIDARWFDTQTKGLGDEYRDQVFANQQSIETRADLDRFTSKFAQFCKVNMPFALDPKNKLTDAIQADVALGKQIGIGKTPTIFIVVNTTSGPRYFESRDPNHDLYQTIDQALAVAVPVPAKTAQKSSKTAHK